MYWAYETYLVIVDKTIDNKIAKLQEYETRTEANAHVSKFIDIYPDAFVVDNPDSYDFSHTTVDVVAKTITYDSVSHIAEIVVDNWKLSMQKTDGGMPRYLEDLITSNSDLILPEKMKTRYDEKVALRATKP